MDERYTAARTGKQDLLRCKARTGEGFSCTLPDEHEGPHREVTGAGECFGAWEDEDLCPVCGCAFDHDSFAHGRDG